MGDLREGDAGKPTVLISNIDEVGYGLVAEWGSVMTAEA
jgi:hypothetical protein